MTVAVWGNPLPYLMSAVTPAPPEAISVSEATAARNLDVDAVALMSHVEAIATQPRFTPTQKQPVRTYIKDQLSRYGITLRQQSYGTSKNGGINLIADIPGTQPEAGIYILGAHYDTTANSPGADDNATALATLLEAARILSGYSNPATLRLVFFDQEEQQPDGGGLLGSLAFANEPENTVGVKGAVTLDMVGYACHTVGCQRYPRLPLQNLPEKGDFITVFGLENHRELIGAFVLSAQTNWPLLISLPIPKASLQLLPDLARSDHAPFWKKGIPAVSVTDTANFRNPNYHKPTDTIDTLDETFFKGSAQHVVNAVAALLSQAA